MSQSRGSGKGKCSDNPNNAPWLRNRSTAPQGQRPDRALYGETSPESLMRSIQTGDGRNRQAGTMQRIGGHKRSAENSPAIAYHNSLMEESFRKTEMINGFTQAQKEKYARVQQLKTNKQHDHACQFDKS